MTSTGRLLAQVLEGCWRGQPPPLPPLSAARLAQVAPLLAGSGAGALVWRRLRRSLGRSLGREHSGAEMLRQMHAAQALDAQMRVREVEKVLRLLREQGIEALLVKGWACARQYPEPGLRPLGDVDLVVRPEQGALAAWVLGVPVDSDEGEAGFVDLKTRLRPIYGIALDEALDGSQRVPLGGEFVRLLSSEHHLRLLCLHFLRHGAWRPLWLCDIAVALEACGEGFSWERCLGPDRRRAEHVACALGLAHRLLGARVEGTPIEERARSLPPWLLRAVLKQWDAPMLTQHAVLPLMASVPRRPVPLLRALRERWPNPIEAAVTGPLPLRVPPLPAQVLLYSKIGIHFLQRSLGGQRGPWARPVP